MKPELLLSVDSERRFWLDPRTKLYMLVIFSIVMIDGKTDGISFWLKPILALVPFVYGTNRNNYNIAAGSIWDTMVSKRHDGLLSSLDYKGQ